jgi:hypothetical protein
MQTLLLRTQNRGVVLPYRVECDLIAGVIPSYVGFDFEAASAPLRYSATFPRARASAFSLLSIEEWKRYGDPAAHHIVPLVALVPDA